MEQKVIRTLRADDIECRIGTISEKGEASDSFKRACVSLRIGRELYTAPFIWVPASSVNITKKQDKLITYDKFSIQSITYSDNREIIGRVIVNQQGKMVYSFADRSAITQGKAMAGDKGDTAGAEAERTDEMQTGLTPEQIALIQNELVRTGVALDRVLQRYGLRSLQDMSGDIYKKAMNSLKRTGTKAA